MGYTHHQGLSTTNEGYATGVRGSEQVLAAAVLNASATNDFGNILDGDQESVDITVTGAVLGDFVLASLGVDVADLQVTAAITAADTATVTVSNSTGGAVDLASTTVKVRVIQ
jgi:hypothetical protein